MRRVFSTLTQIPGFLNGFVTALVQNNNSNLAATLRRRASGSLGMIDTGVVVTNRKNLIARERSHLYHACYILNDNGCLVLGENSHLGAFCYVNVLFGKVEIGNNVAIGPGTKILSYSNHYEKGSLVTDEKIVGDISIGNNVLIGANCTILPGTVIEDDVIIGAGAVVKGHIETNSIYGGVPCKRIKQGWYL